MDDLRETIDRYNAAWNAHDLDAIVAMHGPGMVFENHTAAEVAEGEAVRDHIEGIFAGWPDSRSDPPTTSVGLVLRKDRKPTHSKRCGGEHRRQPSGKRSVGRKACPLRGRARHRQCLLDSVSILRQVGLIDEAKSRGGYPMSPINTSELRSTTFRSLGWLAKLSARAAT